MIVVPVEISHFALSQSKERQVYTYLLLKVETSGHTYLNKRQICDLSSYLDRSHATIWRYLSWLQEKEWIEPNGKVYTIKSWRRVFRLMGFRYVASVEVDPKKIKNPQAFFAGVVLGRLTNFQNYRNSTGKGTTAISSHGGSAKPGYSNFYPVADRALSEILNISSSKANKLKKLAHLHGYVDLKYNYYPFELNEIQVRVDQKQRDQIRYIFDEIGHKMRIDHRGYVSVQDADLIKANLKYKKSWNYH